MTSNDVVGVAVDVRFALKAGSAAAMAGLNASRLPSAPARGISASPSGVPSRSNSLTVGVGGQDRINLILVELRQQRQIPDVPSVNQQRAAGNASWAKRFGRVQGWVSLTHPHLTTGQGEPLVTLPTGPR